MAAKRTPVARDPDLFTVRKKIVSPRRIPISPDRITRLHVSSGKVAQPPVTVETAANKMNTMLIRIRENVNALSNLDGQGATMPVVAHVKTAPKAARSQIDKGCGLDNRQLAI
jgi:hypothetical protein